MRRLSARARPKWRAAAEAVMSSSVAPSPPLTSTKSAAARAWSRAVAMAWSSSPTMNTATKSKPRGVSRARA